MSDQWNDKQWQQVVGAAFDKPVAPSEDYMARTEQLLRSKGRRHRKKSLFSFFRYTPALAAGLLVFIGALTVLIFNIWSRSAPPGSGLLVVSSIGNGQSGSPSFGYEIREKDVIRTEVNEDLELRQENDLGLYVFEESEIVFQTLNRNFLGLELKSGSFYINKIPGAKQTKQTNVAINGYSFDLLGTRVLFSHSVGAEIAVVCYEGVVKASNADSLFLCEVEEGQKLVIDKQGKWRLEGKEALSPAEELLDSRLAPRVPFSRIPPLGSEKWTEMMESQQEQVMTQENSVNPALAEKAGYQVSLMGQLDSDKSTGFYVHVAQGNQGFVLSDNSLYRVRDRGLEKLTLFKEAQLFRIKPVIAGDKVIVISNKALFVIDRDNPEQFSRVDLADDDVLMDNYYGVYHNGAIYLPVQNKGYLKMPLDGKGDLQPMAKESFPVTPVIRHDTIYGGSFYECRIFAIDDSGNKRWQVDLADFAIYPNIVASDSGLYVYLQKEEQAYFHRYSFDGKLSGQWKIPHRIIADFIVINEVCYGIDARGYFFSFNPKSGEYKILATVFSEPLSTGSWRVAGVTESKGKIYYGTDRGALIIYDHRKAEMETEVTVALGKTIQVPPLVVGSIVYCITNEGEVYEISKGEL